MICEVCGKENGKIDNGWAYECEECKRTNEEKYKNDMKEDASEKKIINCNNCEHDLWEDSKEGICKECENFSKFVRW